MEAAMGGDGIILLLSGLTAIGLLSMLVRGGWAERTYGDSYEESWIWFWLRLFKIPGEMHDCGLKNSKARCDHHP